MPANPYSARQNPYEYNIYGDSANGLYGSQQPGAQRNQSAFKNSGGGGGSNAYADILKYLPAAPMPLGGGGPVRPIADPTDPGYGIAPTPTPGPSPMPAPSQPTLRPPSQGFIPTTPGGEDGGNVTSPAPTAPAIGQKPTDDKNQGVSDWAWNTANDWFAKSKAQGYGDAYSWLVQKPYLLDMYKSFVDADPANRSNIDPVDYIHAMFPDLANPGYKRAGFDTFYENGPGKPNVPSWNGQTPPQMSPEEFQKANAAATPLTYGTGYIQQLKDGIAAGTTDPKTLPDDQLGQLGYSQAQIAQLKNSTGTIPVGAPANQQQQGGGGPYGGILSQLQQLLGPQFNYEQRQLNDQMNQQASVLGDTNAGGYRVENQQANTDLINKQNTRLSDYLATAQQNDLQRTLEKYLGDLSSATQKSTASMSAGAAQRAAELSAATQRYGIDINALLGNRRLDLEGQQNQNSYNLGLAGLGLNQYEFDNPSVNALLSAYLNLSPEQMSIIGAGLNFPSYGYQPNYNPYYHP